MDTPQAGSTAVATAPAIELKDIVKRFPGVVANDGINLTVRAGSVHAIVGENGAGKSTLMKTLYGTHRPDEGTITVNGEEVAFSSSRDAISAGIGMVFQHFMLADNFTVWENVVLGDEPGTKTRLKPGPARARLRELGTEYGLSVDPDAFVSDLGVGDKQRVEILKVLYRGANILILDEPTAVLVPQEVDELFHSLRVLTTRGATVIFISHKLDEVLTHADAITVIRQGKTVGEIDDPTSVTPHDLAEMMVGSELPSPETRGGKVSDVAELVLDDVTVSNPEGGRPLVDHVSLTVHQGEVVGIAGVEGNGQSELVHAILGLAAATGSISAGGSDITGLSTRQRRALGIGYIAEDRQKEGLVLTFTIWENTALGHQHQRPFGRGPWIDKAGARKRSEQIIDTFDVRTTGPEAPTFTMSGGNQQKLVVGREMTMEPSVLIASHPTRGVDVGAQALIWDVIRSSRELGMATLLISADLEELIGLSDRLLVMLRGRVVADLDPAKVTPADLGSYMTGVRTADS